MTTQVEMIQEQVEITPNPLFDTARKAYLAGLGIFSLTQEQFGNLFDNAEKITNDLVERGTKVEARSKKKINKLVKQQRKEVEERASEVEKRVSNYSSNLLNRLNLPTANEVEELNKKIASLTRKVERLRKLQEEDEKTVTA